MIKIKCILLTLLLLSAFPSWAEKRFVMYDEELAEIVPKYKAFGGDSFYYLIYLEELNSSVFLDSIAQLIKPDKSNFKFIHELKLHKILVSERRSYLIEVDERSKKPLKYIATCNVSYGIEVEICNFRSVNKGITVEFSLDESNLYLFRSISQALMTRFRQLQN